MLPKALQRPAGLPAVVAGLIAAAVILGIGLRFAWLDATLLWHDEVATRIFAAGYTPEDWRSALYTGEIFSVAEVRRFQEHDPESSVVETVRGLVTHDPHHPPLYYVLARAWVEVFGIGVGALRSLSAVLSLLLLPGLYWLGRELYEDPRAAWAAVALGAVSPFFVLYAQEAREYALWSVLVVLATAALLRAVRLDTAQAWALYVGFAVTALYTSFSTTALLLAHTLFLLRYARPPWRTLLRGGAALAVAGLLFVPWAVALVRQFEAFETSMRWSREIVIPVSSLFRILAFNASRTVVDFWPELDNPAAWVVTGLAMALYAAALVDLRRRSANTVLLLGLCIAVPIGLMLVPDLLFGGIRSVSARYMTPAWLALVLVLAGFLAPVDRARTALLGGVLATGLASCWANAGRDAVWTKGVSFGVPRVAELIAAAPDPLVVGDIERTNPGNLMALSNLVPPDAHMQFLTYEMGEDYVLPRQFGTVFLFGSIPQFRERLEREEGARVTLLYEDLHLQLWRVDP